jgi:hypothetical protein
MDPATSASEQLTLTLKIDPAASPISGSVAELDGEPESFSGWIELISAIELRLDWMRQAPSADPPGR